MRITGGEHRSRTLQAPRGSDTRPTSDRVREALFGILDAQGKIAGARVLDLYAGTGALGLEAISRGAAHATFVESSRGAIAALRANLAALRVADRARVVESSVERADAQLAREAPFDLVLVDPPYVDVSGPAARSIERIVGRGLISPDALVVLEHATRDSPPDLARMVLTRSRVYGDTSLAFYEITTPVDGAP